MLIDIIDVDLEFYGSFLKMYDIEKVKIFKGYWWIELDYGFDEISYFFILILEKLKKMVELEVLMKGW